MIVCKECGFKNTDADSFCGACGGFLEWTGEKQTAPAPVDDDVEEAPRKKSLYERLQGVMYADVGEAKPVESSTPAGPGAAPRPGGPPGAGPPGAGPPPRPGGPPGAGPPGAGPPPRPGGPPPSGPPPRPGGPPPSGPPPRPGGPPPSGPPPTPVPTAEATLAVAGPESNEARQIAAALVAKPPPPAIPGAGPALPERAQSVLEANAREAPEAAEQSSAVQPAAVQPQAAQRRRPPKVQAGKPTRTPQKGDLICGECGEANPPGRKFCSRCGESLASAAVMRIAWWKRLLPRRRAKSAMAGERPWADKSGKKKRPTRRGIARFIAPVRRVAGIVLLLAGLLYGVYSPFRNKVNEEWTSIKDKVMSFIHPKYDLVSPGPGTTSNEPAPLDPNHPAAMATDGHGNTYWLTAPPSADFNPELDVALTEPANVSKIIVHNGASDDFQAHHRPKTLLFIFDTGPSEEVTLQNTPEAQTLTIHSGKGIQHFKIRITGIYESINGTDVALSEIEFFKKG